MSRSILATLAALAILPGCHIDDGPPGELITDTRSIDAGKVEMVRVDLRMGAGELEMTGGASKLLEGEFRHDSRRGKPDIRYEVTGFRGRLSIESSSTQSVGPNQKGDHWKVKLGEGVPIDLHVSMGAGEGDLKLADLSLRSVAVELGAGELKLDLRDDWKKDFDVRIRGGVGEATIYLPRGVGTTVTAVGGIGDIDVKGLLRRGNAWVNDQFEKSKVTVRVDVKGGIGQINLVGE